MTQADQAFLLLSSHLGNPSRRPLSTAQMKRLFHKLEFSARQTEDKELEPGDLLKLGYSTADSEHIVDLLNDTFLLDRYLEKAAFQNIYPVTRADPRYPISVRRCLGIEAPGCIWFRGNPEFLASPCVSLVGSRVLNPVNHSFAETVGEEAAVQGYTLVSGNAAGADQTAQNAAVSAGGHVVSIVADRLIDKENTPSITYLSEYDYDMPFHAQRALSRNRIIHSLGSVTIVAQCEMGKGGTWDGTTKNLQHGWSPVCVFQDGSAVSRELECRGARLVQHQHLKSIAALAVSEPNLFHMQAQSL